jgi:hypothetical protein
MCKLLARHMAMCTIITKSKTNKMDDVLYNKLNKELDYVRNTKCKQTQKQNKHNLQTSHFFYTRIKNLSNIIFNNEETKILGLGLNYVFEKSPKHFLQDLIIDTESTQYTTGRLTTQQQDKIKCDRTISIHSQLSN